MFFALVRESWKGRYVRGKVVARRVGRVGIGGMHRVKAGYSCDNLSVICSYELYLAVSYKSGFGTLGIRDGLFPGRTSSTVVSVLFVDVEFRRKCTCWYHCVCGY